MNLNIVSIILIKFGNVLVTKNIVGGNNMKFTVNTKLFEKALEAILTPKVTFVNLELADNGSSLIMRGFWLSRELSVIRMPVINSDGNSVKCRCNRTDINTFLKTKNKTSEIVVELVNDDGYALNFRCGVFGLTFQILIDEEVSSEISFDDTEFYPITGGTKELLRLVQFANYYKKDSYLLCAPQDGYLVVTDNRFMACSDERKVGKAKYAKIPIQNLQAITKATKNFPKLKTKVAIGADNIAMWFLEDEEVTIYMYITLDISLCNPGYAMEKNNVSCVEIYRKQLLEMAEQACSYTKGIKNNSIRMIIKDGNLTLMETDNYFKFSLSAPVSDKNENKEVCIDAQRLKSCVKFFKNDIITVSIEDSGKPIRFGDPDDPYAIAVTMPIITN